MNTLIALLFTLAINHYHSGNRLVQDDVIRYEPVSLNAGEKKVLAASLEQIHPRYDEKEQMITKKLEGYNYHTDAESGTFHEVRASFNYAVGLLDLGEEGYRQRAFDIIKKTISLQDTVSSSRTAGIWPYYLEEPLSTKKSPADFNWADFNGVALLDIYMGHEGELSPEMKEMIRRSLIYAARSVQKRNIQPGYTNIAIMGTYVTFMTAHLFDLPEMKAYSRKRLENFYDYTLKRGFTEYNSPTYTIIALDELDRMKRHIVDRQVKPMIDSLYNTGWAVVAKHYHPPTGQWAGPHSRAYSSLLGSSVNGILQQASGGRIKTGQASVRPDVKIRHRIPDYLLPYFTKPILPRTQTDTLAIDAPIIVGTTYLAKQYSLSSANRSSLWNQRRPLLAYWGSPQKPAYLQVRFLHDLYDFSSASFYSDQKENRMIAGISFITNGGDKHISIDRIKDGRIRARDLRLRFEFGNITPGALNIPVKTGDPFSISTGNLRFNFQLFHEIFGAQKGYWEKGGDNNVCWLDYVLYKGEDTDIDLKEIDAAALAFTFEIDTPGKKAAVIKPSVTQSDSSFSASWKQLDISMPSKPVLQQKNL